MDPIAEYLLRLLVTLAVLVLAVDLVGAAVLALRGLFRRWHRHSPAARPSAA